MSKIVFFNLAAPVSGREHLPQGFFKAPRIRQRKKRAACAALCVGYGAIFKNKEILLGGIEPHRLARLVARGCLKMHFYLVDFFKIIYIMRLCIRI